MPSHLMSWAEITLTGLTLSVVSGARRDPVTSIFSIFKSGVTALVTSLRTGDVGVCACALTAIGAARLTTMPALNAFMTASESFFRCILFIANSP